MVVVGGDGGFIRSAEGTGRRGEVMLSGEAGGALGVRQEGDDYRGKMCRVLRVARRRVQPREKFRES